MGIPGYLMSFFIRILSDGALSVVLRMKFILTPDGCSTIAAGSGPIGPAMNLKPRCA